VAVDEQDLTSVVEDESTATPTDGEREPLAEGERSGRRRRRGRGRRRGGERTEANGNESDSEQIELLDDEADEGDAESAPVSPSVEAEDAAEGIGSDVYADEADEEQAPEAREVIAQPAPEAPRASAAPAMPAMPAKAAVVVAAPAPVMRERVVGRVSNDPRINPRPVKELEIVTESLVIDPSSFPPVELPVSTRPRPPRAANDPRIGRAVAADAAAEGIAESA